MTLKILALEPFYGGSHKSFLDGLCQHSSHAITALTMNDRHWKWHMRSAPMVFRDQLPAEQFDLIFASDFVDLATFKGLAPRNIRELPIVLYMHENQITYPVQEEKERDRHFGVTNITSTMTADHVWWNSKWHQTDFLAGAGKFLNRMPGGSKDHWLENARRGNVMHLGVQLPPVTAKNVDGPLKIVWNHRWEFDKRPDLFFQAIERLAAQELDFELHVLGERYKSYPEIFNVAKDRLKKHLVSWGYQESRDRYWEILAESDLVVSTADHEFFGLSIIEASHAGCMPLLPRRLSYPEIFEDLSPDLASQIFYDDFEILVETLAESCRNPAKMRSVRGQFSRERFGWASRKTLFDKAFEQVLT